MIINSFKLFNAHAVHTVNSKSIFRFDWLWTLHWHTRKVLNITHCERYLYETQIGFFYAIYFCQVGIDKAEYLLAPYYVSDRVDHRFKIRIIACKTDVFQNDFLPKKLQDGTSCLLALPLHSQIFVLFHVRIVSIYMLEHVPIYIWISLADCDSGDFDYLFGWLCIFCILLFVNAPPM